MAASRSSSLKALRNLGQTGAAVSSRRSLHITGSNSSPQTRNLQPKLNYAPLTLGDLRNECKRRSLLHTGNKHELVDRLAIHDSLQSRAFSIAMKRLEANQPQTCSGLGAKSPAEKMPSRHFNTSRELKSSKDSSTIDFAYLPKLFDGSLDPPPASLRVPILPHVNSSEAQSLLSRNPGIDAAAGDFQSPESNDVMRAQVVTVQETMAGGGADVGLDLKAHASPMSEAADSHTIELGIEQLTKFAERVMKPAPKTEVPVEESDFRKVWNGLLDDLFGEKREGGRRVV
jgi:SAP domain